MVYFFFSHHFTITLEPVTINPPSPFSFLLSPSSFLPPPFSLQHDKGVGLSKALVWVTIPSLSLKTKAKAKAEEGRKGGLD